MTDAAQKKGIRLTVIAVLAFVLVVQVIELGLLQPAERRANRWRR